MIGFLSEESISRHMEYVQLLRHRYAIFEKSMEVLSGRTVREVFEMRISRRDRDDVLPLISEIALHDIFFSSFADVRNKPLSFFGVDYRNSAELLGAVYESAMSIEYGFACVYRTAHDITVRASRDLTSLVYPYLPILAVDVFEHSYFSDYAFNKREYLANSLPYLDIEKLK